jgi:uncharacterized membrane protein
MSYKFMLIWPAVSAVILAAGSFRSGWRAGRGYHFDMFDVGALALGWPIALVAAIVVSPFALCFWVGRLLGKPRKES